ncbi:MAG: class I adenylate-forming enzyme family protein [Candidatus Nitrosotenuis sp.]
MNVIIDFLHHSASINSDKIALVDLKGKLSFGELSDAVSQFSAGLSRYPQNSVISILFENSAEFVISYLGILEAGCIAHLISPTVAESNLHEQIRSAGPKLIIYSKSLQEKIDKVPHEKAEFDAVSRKDGSAESRKVVPSSTAYLIYTSGTTSTPKGVPVSHSNAVFTTKNIVGVLGYNSSDVDVLPLPLSHSFGLGCLHTSLFVGSTLVLHKNTLNVNEIFDSVRKYSATTFAAVPATLTKLLRDNQEEVKKYFENLRLIITNSTPIPPETVNGFKKILKNGIIATYYGLTEASRSTFMIFDKTGKEESVGKTAPHVQIKIVNKNNRSSEPGEILIKGENVIKNYWNNPDADRNINDGWLNTGDVGYFDEDGFLYLTGRTDDIINVAGEKVAPNEVESVVKLLSGVEEAVAIGVSHSIFGQVVKLYVQKSKESKIEKRDVMAHCIKNLERYKVPLAIEFVDSFPRTDYGKIKRFMLR